MASEPTTWTDIESHMKLNHEQNAAGRPDRAKPIYTHRNRQVHIPDGFLAVGLIVGVHGLRGEIKVELHTDFPERFDPGHDLLVGEALQPMRIVGSRPHKGHMLVRLAGIDSREDAETLRNHWIFIAEEEAADLDEDTYWIHDLIGLTVSTEEGRTLGIVSDVLATGANDVYIIQAEPDVNRGKDLLIPAIADVVLEVDLANEVMTIRLQPGMLDEEAGASTGKPID